MSRLLFEEVPRKSKEYMRHHKTEKIILIISASFFSLIGIICLFSQQYLVAAIPFVFAFLLVFCLIKALLREKQYLRIFDDKICYKRTCQRKEKKIHIFPSQYTIELRPATPKSGYTVKFTFKNDDGEKLFAYKSVSLVPSAFQAEKQKWEIDLFAIGCVVLDPQEVIKNNFIFKGEAP